MSMLSNIHPGEILNEDFLQPLGVSQTALARATGIAHQRINEIVLGKRNITADVALRLAKAFGTSPAFWMGLQSEYDLEEAKAQMGASLATVEKIAA